MDKVTVRIVSPAKLGATIYMPGEAEVDADTAAALAAAGILATGDEPPATSDEPAVVSLTASEIDQLVAHRAQVIADTIVASAVERSVAALTAERDDAVARAAAAEARLADLEKPHDVSSKAAEAGSPPAEKTPKRGAAAKG